MTAPIPGPRGVPGLGVAPQLLRDPYRPFLRWAAHYGDAYRPRLPGVTHTIVNHPDLVRQVLGAGGDRYAKGRMNHRLEPVLGDGIPISEGEKWKRNRRLMNPMFGRKQLDSLTATVADAVWERVEGWDRWCGTGEVVDLDPPFGAITMNVLLKAMFGTSVGADDVDHMVADFRHIGRYMAGLMLTVWAPDWMPVPWKRGGHEALGRVNEFIARLITDRRAEAGEHDDLLSLLLDARFEDGSPLSEADLRDELMGLLFGGFETTQSALGWTVALLDSNPDAASSVFEELESLDGALPTTWDSVQSLRWTKACFDEAQRLQGAPLFSREAVVPDEIGGIPVPAGSLVAVSPFALHRTPSLWKDPERYDPGRFLDAEVDRFAFIPFGAGPRHCIGSNLAYLEAVLTLAAMYSRYRVRMQTGFTPQHDFHLSTGMKGGCPVTIHARRARIAS
jgi:cytochrome P450